MFKAKPVVCSAVFSIAAFLSVMNCNAGVFTYTYTGHVFEGSDEHHFFGSGGILDGLAYTSTFTYSTPAPGSTFVDSGTSQRLNGGSFYGNTGPVSATITINGVTLSIDGSYQSEVYRDSNYSPPNFAQAVRLRARDFTNDQFIQRNASINNDIFSKINTQLFNSYDLTTPLNAIDFSSKNVVGFGGISFSLFDKATNSYLQNIGADLNIDSVSVQSVSTVPEPCSMLVFGGLAGLAAVRFRRKKAA